MVDAVWFPAGAAAAYLAGAVPFGYLIGRMRGVDVRTVGSGNIGATNVFRTVGKKWGLLAFALDFAKGFVPTCAALSLTAARGADGAVEMTALHTYLPLLVGVTTVVGHMFTCFMGFRGGKGVATAAGMLMALAPAPTGMALGVFAVVMLATHYVSVGSCVAALFMLVAIWFSNGAWGYADPPAMALLAPRVMVSAVCLMTIWKHRSNVARLLRGTENRIY